jgi:hypothetical protein
MLEELFKDKTLKPKERTEQLSKLVSEGAITISDLIKFADKARPYQSGALHDNGSLLTLPANFSLG